MRKLKYNSNLFYNKKNPLPKIVKPNLTLTNTFKKKSLKIYNGIQYYKIDEIQKKHLNKKIGSFVFTRKTKN